jgi:hypothetical protein
MLSIKFGLRIRHSYVEDHSESRIMTAADWEPLQRLPLSKTLKYVQSSAHKHTNTGTSLIIEEDKGERYLACRSNLKYSNIADHNNDQ